MPLTDLVPLLAAAATAAYAVLLALDKLPKGLAVVAPLALLAGFAGWTALAALREGPLGFWPEHTRNLWGVQIWVDLLLAAAIALGALVPQARALGMRPLPWVALVLCTGSIGLLAMLARIQMLRARA